ncbi:6533_t:CDS:2 [Entrophospora sp. SA101]|nr:6142_t:CDS:2 [Entrophospora sp. SA101]CAJ0769377.1 6533_t:CDS:2 [Entrophospora sp. SA101]
MIDKIIGHDDSVVSVSFSKDGQYVATGGMDGKIMVWKVENGQHVATLEGPNEITWLDWHPKGNVILAGTAESTIWMWQIPSGNFMNLFAGHSASVTAGQFTPDGKKIVTGSEDSSLIVWDPKNATSIFKLSNDDSRFHHEGITSLAINKENSLVLTGSMDHSAKLINLTNGHIIGSFENHTDSIETVGFSDISSLAATGSVDNKLNIWDLTTMRLRQTCQHDDAIVQLQWHHESPLITTCSVDKTVRIWDYRTGNCEKVFHGHDDTILGFVMSNPKYLCSNILNNMVDEDCSRKGERLVVHNNFQ